MAVTATSQGDQSIVAIIDVDGVLFDYSGSLSLIAAEIAGRPLRCFPPAEVYYFMTEQWGMTPPEYEVLVHGAVREFGLFGFGVPLPGSLAGWTELRRHVDKIHIATHCGFGETEELAQQLRLAWLEQWGFEYDELTFTPDKAAVASEYLAAGWAVYSIEDYEENFRALENAGSNSFIQHQRWNRHIETENRVRDIEEFALRIASHSSRPAESSKREGMG